ncbi:putative ABC transport system permease protein [Pseudonocardia ammonioxydans]|uniref:Putative ABC transport system permease protein n=1 Tax=Pseudonocardia ammonioxydans TaxID=260086 RepID=A0A1I5EIH3_PSUAM|nr:FtsX-like permease family protein [Pseudonocardia ammonioxydans]SFO11304.1 putative ABC transport system permease protein [Pseudonocardia ammonioxydans]
MIAWGNLRTRWRELVATVLAVAVGVGLLGAVLLAADAARPPVQDRFAATSALAVPPAVAESRTPRTDGLVPWPAGEADALAARLRATPGVTAAVPDRSFPAVPMPGGRPFGVPEDREGGHGFASLALGGYRVVAGEAPRRPGEAVVGAALGLMPGATVPVLFADAVRPVRVTGVTDGPGVYLTDTEAARYAPGVRTIGVLGAVPPAPTGVTLLSGDDRGAVEPVQDSRVRHRGTQLLAALGLLTGVTTAVVVSAALSTVVAGRRRELGLLRTVGATPGQVRRTVLGEAALTGAAGAVLGTALAVGLAPALYRALVAVEAAQPVDGVPPVPGPLLTAGAAGVLLALGGGLAASRTAARATPLDVVVDRGGARTTSRPRLVSGVVTLLVGAGLATATAVADGDGRIGLALTTGAVLVVAAALLAPVVIGGLAGAGAARRCRAGAGAGAGVDAVARARAGAATRIRVGAGARSPGRYRTPFRAGVTATLVRAEAAAAPARAAAVTAPAVVAVGFAVLIGGLVDTMAAAYPAERTAVLAGSVAVEQDGAPGLPDAAVRALAVPGARTPLPTVLVLPGSAGPTAVDAVGTADPGLVRPGEVVLAAPVATALGVTAGDTVPARFADGTTVPLRVTATPPPDERRGDVVVDRAQVRTHDPAALTDTAFLPVGAVPDPLPPGAVARDAQAYALADYAVDARLTTALAGLLVAVSAGYGGIAVAGGITADARSRRTDRAALVAAGATRARLAATAAAEATLAALLGAVLGLVVTLPPLAAVASGLARATGVPVLPVIDPGWASLAAGGCLVVAAATAALTTGRAARHG